MLMNASTFKLALALYSPAPAPRLPMSLLAQRFLLGEIIKASVDVPAMIDFIKQHNIEQPDWHNIQIPRGELRMLCSSMAGYMHCRL